jgi:hypothetical protein
MRCDHCRGRFGLAIHRHRRLHFCSRKCRDAYRLRRNEEAIERISSLISAAAKTIQVAAQVLLPRSARGGLAAPAMIPVYGAKAAD